MQFYFVRYYTVFIAAVSCFLVVCGVISMYSVRGVISERLASVGCHFFKDNHLINILIIFVFVLNCLVIPLEAKMTSSAVISLSYTGASQGLTPNGTRFDEYEILSDEVLEAAVQKGGLELTADELCQVLSLDTLSMGNDDNSAYFIRSQYTVRYKANENTYGLDGAELVRSVTDAYKEWFSEQYSENVSAIQIDISDIEGYDYTDICAWPSRKAELIGAYMYDMSDENSTFKAYSNGETFYSVAAQADMVKDVMLPGIEAYIAENCVSKNPEEYIERLIFENIFMSFDMLKLDAAIQNNLDAISMYESSLAHTALVPTYDEENQFYMSQTKTGIDKLAGNARSYVAERIELHGLITSNNDVLKTMMTKDGTDDADIKANELIENAENELLRISQLAQTLVREYDEQQSGGYMTVTVSDGGAGTVQAVIKVICFTLLFAAGAYLCMTAKTVKGLSGARGRTE